MTTNHIERIDEALIRPGRVDVKFHIGKASKAAAGELFDQFFASSIDGGEAMDPKALQQARDAFLAKIEDNAYTVATLQGVLTV